MHRIDTSTAATSLPEPSSEGQPGYFTEGDPSLPVPATVVGADFLNMVQEELATVVEASDQELDQTKQNYTQLLSAIQSIIHTSGLGVPYLHVGEAPPAGSVICCPNELSRVDHQRLWDWINVPENNFKIVDDATYFAGTPGAFSSGNGTTTFRVPTIQDFVRGLNLNNLDEAGEHVEDTVERHAHGTTAVDIGVPIEEDPDNPDSIGNPFYGAYTYYTSDTDALAPVPPKYYGGDETAPKHVKLLWCMKY